MDWTGFELEVPSMPKGQNIDGNKIIEQLKIIKPADILSRNKYKLNRYPSRYIIYNKRCQKILKSIT